MDLEGTGAGNQPSQAVSIRQTGDDGRLITNNYAGSMAPDSGASTRTITNNMTISWTPNSSVNPTDNSVSGVLTYTISSIAGQPLTAPLSETLTVARSMSLGVIGATGGNYGYLNYSSNGSEFLAGKGVQEVQVNYLNQSTNQPIAPSSKILANVGDTLAIGTQGVEQNQINYNYLAPEFTQYEFESAKAITVVNNDSSNNIINVYYNKLGLAHFVYQYAPDVLNTAPSLPLIIDTFGNFGNMITQPVLPELPENYFISSVATSDGLDFSSIDEAIAHEKYTDNDIKFTLIVSEKTQPSIPVIPPHSPNTNLGSEQSASKNSPQIKEKINPSAKSGNGINLSVKKVEKNASVVIGKTAISPVSPKNAFPEAAIIAQNNQVKNILQKSANSAHDLSVKVAGTVGLITGGVVALGTMTSLGKFSKLLRIIKK